MFRRGGFQILRAARAFSQRPVVRANVRRAAIGSGGVGTSLGLSFFSKKKEEPKKESFADFDDLIREADQFFDKYLVENFQSVISTVGNSETAEILWRLVKTILEKSRLSEDLGDKTGAMKKAYGEIERELKNEIKTGNFKPDKLYGIVSEYVGDSKKGIADKAKEIRGQLEKAIKVYKNDPMMWHVLGLWHLAFADIGHAAKKVAKTVTGLPVDSTYEDALHYFEQAEKLKPGFDTANAFYLAETYDRLGKKERAIEYYKKSYDIPAKNDDDKDIQKKALERLRERGIQQKK
ncbi:unnamed protein product [Caenorhabditis auriculariae]|uniref:Regulator of microtubule dynamics protein 1 n=1 Tax=Caenorhabditis auriculariae TaxID=2777116 RepID=A0A8S1H667_9PELO|nr:unnamed protein product [Caenorhabditis auriculariae]